MSMHVLGRKDSVLSFGANLDTKTFKAENIGECTVPSTLEAVQWVDDDDGVLLTAEMEKDVNKMPESFTFVEKAGPREKIFFNPKETTVAIITCGGLCPGLNNVIRALTMCLWHRYGVRKILGFKYGYQGLNPATSECIELTPDVVAEYHRFGGTMLASSRGSQDIGMMVDFLLEKKVDILFTLGGDGTQRGAERISQEVQKRGCRIACVGIPKTIDNDVAYVERTFGFETAVEQAQAAISAAHEEARGAKYGVGIVKLMGRDSGFVALHASLANCDTNICLIPEVDFTFDQILNYVTHRFTKGNRDHCVIVVAEGAGQQNVAGPGGTDASGNVVYGDIGPALRDFLNKGLKAKGISPTIKYIDPSYIIRSAPTCPGDSVFCVQLSHMAAHAAMAGKTGIIVGMLNSQFVHIPIHKSVEVRKKVDIKGPVYQSLLDNTGQPKSWEAWTNPQ